MIKNIFAALAVSAVLLAATAQSDEAKSYDFKVDKFTWVDTQGCVATLNGGKLTQVMDGVGKEDCAKVSSIAEVSVNVTTDTPAGMLATFRSSSFDTFTCWYKNQVGGAAKTTGCED